MSTWLTDRGAFESLFTAAPSGIIAVDPRGGIVESNPAWTSITGYARDDVVGRNVRTLNGAGATAFMDDALAAAAKHQSLRREIELRRKDGTPMIAQITSIPVAGSAAGVYLFLVTQDITSRLTAERSLEYAQRDLREILENMPTPTVVFDREQKVVDLNPAALAVMGYAREHCIGFRLQAMLHPDTWEQTQEAFNAALSGGVGQARAHLKDAAGNDVYFDVTHVPMYGLEGVVGVFALLDNVTQQTRAFDEMAQLRQNFQLLFEHNPAVVLALDTDQRITDINPAGLQVSGFPRDEIVGENVGSFVPPSQRDRVRTFLNQTMRGETLTFDVDAYAADGRIIQYRATTLPIVSHNRVIGAYGLLENLTERLRAERTVAAQREELLDLEHDFRSLFDRNPDGVCLAATDGTILDVNESTVRMSQRSRDEIVGQNFRVFLQGTDLERGWAFFRRALEGQPTHFEITSNRGDGRQLILDMTVFPKYVQGLAVGVYAVFQDITEKKIAQRKVELQAQRIRDLYLLATTAEYTDAQIMSTLQTGCRLLAMESGAIVELSEGARVNMRYDSLQLFSGDDGELLELAKSIGAQREPVTWSTVRTDGGPFGSWIASRLVVGGALHGVLVFFSHTRRDQAFEEIDQDTLALMAALVATALERRRTRSRLRTLAYYDSLTGLPNRSYFQEQLRDALLDPKGHAKSLAVLFFDLDRFKDINDTLGHAMGDRFLQMVANRLVRAVGDNGLVARMGGDEFIILLYDCGTAEHAQRFADMLLQTVDQAYRLDGYEQFVTTSIGVSMYPQDGRDDQTLIKNADIAMYRAKDRGGNGYFLYNQSLERPLRARLTEEKRLRRAIQQEQFVLHYQPIVDVAAGTITGVEALVRWNDPHRGLIYPDTFIPIAEASGLIVDLGEWIFQEATRQVRRWHSHIADLCLAVNISARQFHQPDLCKKLREILEANGLPAQTVELEITESMALSDVIHSIEVVRQLKEIGARIAVDDFGTGHSSLNYLRRFDIDQIKIDRSFVAGIGLERSDEAIVKAIIAMGHGLGLRIVAEGVETREQCDFLKANGCDRVQGYFFSRPVEAAQLQALVLNRGTFAR